MPDVWVPGVVRRPGFNANYTNGRSAMRTAVMHFTVGVDSTSVGDKGYFNWLVPKAGPAIQFAEADSLTWHAGAWNPDGPGTEFERLSWDEPLTDNQLAWGRTIVGFLHDQWGIPLDFYDGPRVVQWDGFINHASLGDKNGDHQDHTDGISRSDWSLMLLTPPLDTETVVDLLERPDMFVLDCKGQPTTVVIPEVRDAYAVTSVDDKLPRFAVDPDQRNYIINSIRSKK